MNNLCLIPARGGSKRIPKKNIKPFLGKPIIAYSIEAAINSNLFSEIMVSTDNEKIAEIAIKYGAKVPFFRTHENSSDFATTFDVIEEVIGAYRKENIEFDNACCLYPCAPFVNSGKLEEAYEEFKKNKRDVVFPVIPYSFPIQRAITMRSNKIEMISKEFLSTRSQDLEQSYHDSGQFYFFNIKKVIKNKSLLTDNTGAIIISEMEGQDIDNEIDWKLAELKYQLINK